MPRLTTRALLLRVNRILKTANNARYDRKLGAIVPLNSPKEVQERIGLAQLAKQMGLLK